MSLPTQPNEADLEHVVSLSASDVRAMDAALISAIPSDWRAARQIVESVHAALLPTYPSVPAVFISYRLRKLVAAVEVEAHGIVDRRLEYQVRAHAR